MLGIKDGKPTVTLSNPSVSINMGSISIHGSVIGWLVELLTPIFRGQLEGLLEGELENLVKGFVNDDLAGILEKLELKVGVPVPPPFDDSGLHFNLTSISAHSDHIGVDLSVAIVDPRDPTRLVRQPVNTVIPDAVDTSKMLSVSLAPEVIEDILHFHQDKWTHTVQPGDVPSESPLGLDSTSLTLMTTPPLGSVFGLGKDMPLTVSLGGNTSVRFGEGTIELNLPSLFKFDVKTDAAEPEHAFTLQAPVDGTAVVRVDASPQKIRAELQSLSLTPISTKESHSSIWFVNTLLLSPLLGFLEESVIMPALNSLIDGGVACCEVDGFALRGLTSRLSSGALTVFSDIELDLRSILR